MQRNLRQLRLLQQKIRRNGPTTVWIVLDPEIVFFHVSVQDLPPDVREAQAKRVWRALDDFLLPLAASGDVVLGSPDRLQYGTNELVTIVEPKSVQAIYQESTVMQLVEAQQ